jgi:hypothetical protein
LIDGESLCAVFNRITHGFVSFSILKAKRADNPQHKANGLSALRLCVWLCDNCGIELFYADYYFPFALRTV